MMNHCGMELPVSHAAFDSPKFKEVGEEVGR